MQVRVAIPVLNDLVHHFHAARGSDAAWRALSAGFERAELHRKPRHLRHVDRVVKSHRAAVPNHRLIRSKRFVIQRRIELRLRDIRAKWTADLDRANRSSTAVSYTHL